MLRHTDNAANQVYGCTMAAACNYDATATIENGTCLFPLSCQTCNYTTGTIALDPTTGKAPCSCDEEDPTVPLYEDALNHCGGDCVQDADGDGICDDPNKDPCLGNALNIVDHCGACQTDSTFGSWVKHVVSGELKTLGADSTTIGGSPTGFCNCQQTMKLNACMECVPIADVGLPCGDFANATDTIPNAAYYLAVLSVADSIGNGILDSEDIEGCTDNTACNYNANATWGLTSLWCDTLDVCGVCGGGAAYNNGNPDDGLVDGRCDCNTFPAYAKD